MFFRRKARVVTWDGGSDAHFGITAVSIVLQMIIVARQWVFTILNIECLYIDEGNHVIDEETEALRSFVTCLMNGRAGILTQG